MKLLIISIFALLAVPQVYSITGGSIAELAQFPYQVLVGDNDTIANNHLNHCSGVILSEWFVLTAARCIYEHEYPLRIQVKVGVIFVNNEYEKFIPASFIMHPYSTNAPSPYDIALLKLSQPLVFNEIVKPIELPTSNFPYPSGSAILTSWGVNENGEHNTQLRYANVDIINYYQCLDALSSLWDGQIPLDSTNICTAYDSSKVTICEDDKGSPLVQGNTLLGVVSWKVEPCGTVGAPAIYTNVAYYLDWIHEKMNES